MTLQVCAIVQGHHEVHLGQRIEVYLKHSAVMPGNKALKEGGSNSDKGSEVANNEDCTQLVHD